MLSESEMDGLATKKAASPPPTYDGGGERKGVGYYRNWAAFFLLGTINNLPYVIINSSAKILADSLGEDQYVSLVMFGNVALGLITKGTSTLLSVINFPPYWFRFLINGLLMLGGLLGVAFATNFWVAFAAILIAGSSATFGESLTLGYLRNHDRRMVNAWSSGTGFAGVAGACLYIMLTCIAGRIVSNDTSRKHGLMSMNRISFLSALPMVLVYWFAYFILIPRPKKKELPSIDEKDPKTIQDVEESVTAHQSRRSLIEEAIDEEETKPLLSSQHVAPAMELRHSKLSLMAIRIWRCWKLTFWLSFNLSAVYAFEYTVRSVASQARPQIEYNPLACPELYSALQLCYQAGVFVSRSSLSLVKIRRVEVLTVLQCLNMVVWILQAVFKFLPVCVLPSYMVFVGLLGGASYANIFYMLRTDRKFPDADREVCINLSALSITIGILSGTLFELGLQKVLLNHFDNEF